VIASVARNVVVVLVSSLLVATGASNAVARPLTEALAEPRSDVLVDTSIGVGPKPPIDSIMRRIAPTIDREDPGLAAVRNEGGARLIADQRRSGGAYVLPPDTGSMTLENVTLAETIQLCPEMRELQQQARALSVRMAELALDTGPLELEVQLLQRQRQEADERAAEYSDYGVLAAAADELDFDLEDLSLRVEELIASFCTPDACPADVAMELNDLALQRSALEAELEQVRADAEARGAAYRSAVAERAQLDAAVAAREQAYFAQLDQVQQLRQSVLDLYAVYARTTGGRAVARYDNGWQSAVTSLLSDNPGLWFEPIPTRTARVHVSLLAGVGTDAYLATNPAVLDFTVNGSSVAATTPIAPLPSYPQSIEATTVLSLVSACVVADPQAYDVEKASAGVPLFGLTVSYEYPTVSQVTVDVRYNTWQLRQLARSRYFGVSALEALLARATSSGAVAFHWTDTDTETPVERRQQFELRVLWQLLQQLWASTAYPIYDGDSVRVYGGPSEPHIASPITADTPLELRSLSGDARYASALDAVVVGERVQAGQRSVGGIALGAAAAVINPSAIPRAALSAQVSVRAQLGDADAMRIPMREPAAVDPSTVREEDGKKRVVEAISIPKALSDTDTRVIASGLRLARRAVDPTCGWYHLTCDGLAWLDRPGLSDDTLQALLDAWQTLRFSPAELTYRTAATVFNP
jgi:hypothetical protein